MEQTIIGIYRITNPNGKVYIGQSVNVKKRFKRYLTLDISTKHQTKLWRSFEKHGVNSHVFDVIEECEIDKLNERERYWQDYYNVLCDGLNCVLTETNEKRRVISDEYRCKLSKTGDEHPKGFKGKKHTDENKIIFSQTHKGKTVSSQTRKKQSEAKKGKPLSEGHKTKMKGERYSYNGRKIINVVTGQIFESINLAAQSVNCVPGTLSAKLNGRLNNNTPFRYHIA